MTRVACSVAVISIWAGFACDASGQTFPQLRDAQVRSRITGPDAGGFFSYEYTVTNGAASDAPVFTFDADISRDPGTVALSAGGLVLDVGPTPRDFAAWVDALGRDPSTLVPVGCASPEGWDCYLTVQGTVMWGNNGTPDAAGPGASVGGFELRSQGLPRTAGGALRPDFVIIAADGEASEEESAAALLGVEAVKFPVRIVSPGAPPDPFDPVAFAARIDGYRAEARALGWIQTDAASAEFAARIDTLEAALEEARIGDAKGVATAFIDRVIALSCTELSCPTSPPLAAEAHALLRFNMEFLRAQLPNAPPECDEAVASPNRFWPPNHTMNYVDVMGVFDPDGDLVTLQITSARQDEDVVGGGSGNQCPDAIIEGDRAQIRSERAGTMNGRVYRLTFTATDPAGASCSGEVRVCMPHEESDNPICEEEPLTFDSTACP